MKCCLECPLKSPCIASYPNAQVGPPCASKSVELAATDSQQIKAEIAALVKYHFDFDKYGIAFKEVGALADKLRQLSAV